MVLLVEDGDSAIRNFERYIFPKADVPENNYFIATNLQDALFYYDVLKKKGRLDLVFLDVTFPISADKASFSYAGYDIPSDLELKNPEKDKYGLAFVHYVRKHQNDLDTAIAVQTSDPLDIIKLIFKRRGVFYEDRTEYIDKVSAISEFKKIIHKYSPGAPAE
ncbi:hypothetical protein JXB41_02830 [Candidatus Woesearchaeota archaeon]|nr:hypothetical protein [Candidatus Woesearchaeota archaeon]